MTDKYRSLAKLLRDAADAIEELANAADRIPSVPDVNSVLDLPLRKSARTMSARTRNICASAGAHTLRDLSQRSKLDLFSVRGCGEKTMDEIEDELVRHGLTFKPELEA